MAFPTALEIAQLGQVQRANSPLAQLGQLVQGGFQGYQQGQAMKERRDQATAAKSGEAAAANYLKQAVENPDQQDQFFLKAYEASPDFVSKFMQTKKTQGEAEQLGSRSSVENRKLQLRELEYQANLTRQALDQETNELKRQELMNRLKLQEEKIKQESQKTEEAESKKESSVMMANEAATLAREIAESPNLGSITGTIAPRVGTVSPESQDLINKASRLQSLLTVDNLKLMSGVLTDRDIGFLTNVSSGLNLTDNGILGSKKAVHKRLTDIASKIEGALTGGEDNKEQESPKYKEGQIATNPQTGQKLIFRGGQWQAQ